MDLIDIISTPFMQRSFLSAVLLASLFGLFGTFIVPRRLGFMADGISHGSLLGIALGLLLGVYPILIAIIVASLYGFMLSRVSSTSNVTQDGLVGVFLSGGMGGAIIILSYVPGYKPELFSYLFGNILTIQWTDIYFLTGFFILITIIFVSQWRSLVITTVHNDLSHVIDLPVDRTKYFLFIGTSITLIAGVKLLGVILVSALLIIPVLIANQFGQSLRSTFGLTQFIGIFSTLAGILISYVMDYPTGPSVAILLVMILMVALLYKNIKAKLSH
jgi:zinc transport system permease protein